MGGTSSKKQKEMLKKKTEEYVERLERALIGCNQARTTFATLTDLWSSGRQETITTLCNVADEIDRHHYNVNIANLTGASSSIAGGTAAIASLVLAPFSGGTSVVLAAGGLFGTVAGTATTLGANVVEVILTKELMETAKKALDADEMFTTALSDSFRELLVHENEVFAILAELQGKNVINDLIDALKASNSQSIDDLKLQKLKNNTNSFEDMLTMMSCLFAEDRSFLNHLQKTEILFNETPTLSSTLSTSTDFFQALKELSVIGPETLRSISGAALQSTAASNAQMVALGAQVATVGLGAIFVALDVYHLVKTSKNYDEGSKTELAAKIRTCVDELQSERNKIEPLGNFYKERMRNVMTS